MNEFQKAKAAILGAGSAFIATSFFKDSENIKEFEKHVGDPILDHDFIREKLSELSKRHNGLKIVLKLYESPDCAMVTVNYTENGDFDGFIVHISLNNDKITLYHEIGHIEDYMKRGKFSQQDIPDVRFVEKKKRILQDEESAWNEAEKLFTKDFGEDSKDVFDLTKNICLNTYRNQLNRNKVGLYTAAAYGVVSLVEWMVDDIEYKGSNSDSMQN